MPTQALCNFIFGVPLPKTQNVRHNIRDMHVKFWSPHLVSPVLSPPHQSLSSSSTVRRGKGFTNKYLSNSHTQPRNNNKEPDSISPTRAHSHMQYPLRPYQQTIVHSAVQAQGGIVYLPTGAGKTLIAAEVVRQSFESQLAQAQETGSDVPPRDTAVIVVPTVALLTQQCDYFDSFFKGRMPNAVECLKVEGGRAFPTLNSNKKFHVLVGVSQALRNNLPSINPFNVAILVVDEVHHCTGQHPSAAVAVWARDLPTPPWILGLTASLSYAIHEQAIAKDIVAVCDCLGVSNSSIFSATPAELDAGGYHSPAAADPISVTLERPEKRLRNLEGCDHRLPQAVLGVVAQSRSQGTNGGANNDAGVMPLFTLCFDALLALEDRVAEMYGSSDAAKRSKLRAFQCFIDGDDTVPFGDLSNAAGKLFLDLVDQDAVESSTFLPAIERLRQNRAEELEKHVVLAAYLHLCDVVHLLTVTKQESIEVAFWYLKDFALPELMNPSVRPLCRDLVELLVACSSDDDEVTQELTQAMGHDVAEVVKLLGDWLNKTESSEKAAVFATHRLTVAVLAKRLNTAFQDERPNMAMPLYARGKRVGWHVGGKLSNTAFNERIDMFHNDGNVNIIVATQVCEEGLDIPSCSFVIHFDPPNNPVSHVQRAGRARAEGSTVRVVGNVDHLAQAVSQQQSVAAAAADGHLLHMTLPANPTNLGQQGGDLQSRMAKFRNFRDRFAQLMRDPEGKTPLQVLNELLQYLGSPKLNCDPKRRSRFSDLFEVSCVCVTLLRPPSYEWFTLECTKSFSGASKKHVKQAVAEGLLQEIHAMFLRYLLM